MKAKKSIVPFDKHSSLIVRETEPFNAGPPPRLLHQAFITPQNLFFVRNHAPVPEVDPASYRLIVRGLVNEPLSLSLDELRSRFTKREVAATLQCAGNRRDMLTAIAPVAGEVPWGAEAISNARWGGVALRDVLDAAWFKDEARHVAFLGLDEIEKRGERFGFGGSVPVDKALGTEVILAYEMNGEPLPPVHGFPLRAIVPGYIGARSVKWLSEITLQTEPSDNYYQARAYKLFPPQTDAESADWERGLMLGELSVNSVITAPASGATIEGGSVLVQGYATAGGSRSVERVDVSADDGRTWTIATLAESDGEPWTWRLWEARLELPAGIHTVTARAWDSAANTQPEDPRRIWNFKGYMNNAWDRVTVSLRR